MELAQGRLIVWIIPLLQITLRHYPEMGSYYGENARVYSGYDEYAGSFGPLQVSSSTSFRSRGRLPPSRRGFSNLKQRKDRKPVAREFDRRAKYLANRKAKRHLQPQKEDGDGAENVQDKKNEPASGPQDLQRQVWLPTRNFTFRQRAGKLDTRAIARLDLEKIAATTDIETIQKHLENLAFSDVTVDDVQHYSDDYFLKLFQIAQLTLEYLMHVQDSLVDHTEGLEKQCEQLMTECQQLESENGQHETEITSLKREIWQKQRTMATLELMLLNASASNRIGSSAKENAAREANALVDDLLNNRTDPAANEEGSITNPVSCVLCGKRFVSPEYLIRHQQRRHQDAKRKKKKSTSSSSDSDTKKEKKKLQKPAPLPKEVLDALEEKNQLAKQLLALQDQVRVDHESRDRQRQQLESQQNQMSSRVEQYMEKLQATLVEIEKKQEATKQDLRQYTQEAIARLQVEAANAELLRLQAQKPSRAGRLENDDGEQAENFKKEEAGWSEKVEKLMDTFMKAQAQKQQEVDALEQESSKLWSKYNKLKKKRRRPEPTMRLADLTALDVERFGLDRGEVVETETAKPVVPKPIARLEDKLVQTDEEDEAKPSKREPMICEEIQTEPEPKVSSSPVVAVPPIRMEVLPPFVEPPISPAPKKEKIPVLPASIEKKEAKSVDSTAKLQQAAHIIGKVALGFLARRALAKTSNWSILIDISSLEEALTAPELEEIRQNYGDRLFVQVEEAMTANELRVSIAKALSGENEFEVENPVENDPKIAATMTYHRVLLHHKHTGAELSGDMIIHELKNVIEVEIIPYHEVAATQIGDVIQAHGIISDRIEDIKRASMELSLSGLPTGDGTSQSEITSIVRLQALVRGFLAKKNAELLKIDRLVDARLVRRRSASTGEKTLGPSWMSLDPVLAAEYEKAQRRLTQLLRVKLHRDEKEDLTLLANADYEKQTADVDAEQKDLPLDVQRRIQLLTMRLNPMATGEYRRRESDKQQEGKTRTSGAAKIHRAVQVEVVRKRLKRLVADNRVRNPKLSDSIQQVDSERFASTNALLLSWLSKSRDSFDSNEIDQFANAYEEGKSPVEVPEPKASIEKESSLPETKTDANQEEKPLIPQPLTPRLELDDVEADSEDTIARPGTPVPDEANRDPVAEIGRSPRPSPSAHEISPFSHTPLISRRAAARRGTGFDNAR
ncbi:hypothetical protein V7S43_000081 [Phytophthora oleae]|uniref:C2H2-type domain-containing protein n=1 Tax=Phytophthora oleae TaxID=2107226 RepID=A0ABD3G7Y8_9STRA